MAPAGPPDGVRSWRRGLASWVGGSVATVVVVFRDAPAHRSFIAVLLVVSLAAVVLLATDPGRRRATSLLWIVGLVGSAALPAPVGRTPAVIAYLSASVAFGALVRWRPQPRWPQRTSPIAGTALLVFSASQLAWIRWTRPASTVALLGAAVVLLEVHARRPALTRRVDSAVAGVARSVGTGAAALIVFLIAIPLLYLPGAFLRAGRAVTGSGSGDGWHAVGISPDEHRRDALRPFTSTPRPVMVRRHLVSAVWATLGVVAAAGIVVLGRTESPAPATTLTATPSDLGRPSPTEGPEAPPKSLFALEFATPYSSLPAYRDVAWADELQRHQAQPGDVTSEYVNIVDGVRRTHRSTLSDAPEVTIWFSGGSAAAGVGQRDEHTIASELVRVAEDHGIALDVVNIGRNGATIQEEVTNIEQRLLTEPPPDLIVSYTGWNDILVEVAFEFAHGLDGDRSKMADAWSLIRNVNEHPAEFLASDIGPSSGEVVADRIVGFQQRLDRAARAHGASTAYFFQPDALLDRRQLEGYESLSGIADDQLMASPLSQALDVATARLEPTTTNLRPLFADYPSPVFLGLVHQNEEGARRVAEAIFDELSPRLDEPIR